jgi:hypothetical protein
MRPSQHPYENSLDQYTALEFPGATAVKVTFDNLTKLEVGLCFYAMPCSLVFVCARASDVDVPLPHRRVVSSRPHPTLSSQNGCDYVRIFGALRGLCVCMASAYVWPLLVHGLFQVVWDVCLP